MNIKMYPKELSSLVALARFPFPLHFYGVSGRILGQVQLYCPGQTKLQFVEQVFIPKIEYSYDSAPTSSDFSVAEDRQTHEIFQTTMSNDRYVRLFGCKARLI